MRKIKFGLKAKIMASLFAVLIGSAVAFLPAFTKPASAWPCNHINAIECGVSSPQDLANRIRNNDQSIKTVFDQIGIFANDIADRSGQVSNRLVAGDVHKDGTVWVNGQMVASNVIDGQRGTDLMLDKTNYRDWAGLQWTSPSNNFFAQSIPAYVYMYNGHFKYAILVACGNPVFPTREAIPPHLTIEKTVSTTKVPVLKKVNVADPGDTIHYNIAIRSTGEVSAEDARFWDNMPTNETIIPNTGKAYVGNQVYNIPDAGITGGWGLNDMPPGQVIYVTFEARLTNNVPTNCLSLVNTAFTQASRVPTIFDTATVNTCGQVPQVPTLTIQKDVSNQSQPTPKWEDKDTANPGNKLFYSVKISNNSQTVANHVVVWDVLPSHIKLATLNSGATAEVDINGQTLKLTADDLKNGKDIGDLAPGQYAYLYLKVTVNDDFVQGGCTELVNTGLAKAKEVGTVSDTATTTVCVNIPGKHTIIVNKFNDLNGDGKREANEPLLPNWQFTLAGKNITETQKTSQSGSTTFTGLDDGQYTITETMQPGWRSTTGISQTVSIGPDQTVMFGNQQITPPPTTPPSVTPPPVTQLPTAGPVDAATGAMGTMGLGYVGYVWRKSKKTLMRNLRQ